MIHFKMLFGRILFAAVVVAPTAGCKPKGWQESGLKGEIPPPINLLLPKAVEIHPFTQTGTFDEGESGVHVRIQARDAYGDPTKAFGDFRFELYEFRPHHQNHKGARLGRWEVKLSQPKQNMTHWDRHTRSYEFKLGWDQNLPTGQRVILVAVFTSRFTPRITTEREIVAGE